MKPKKENIRGEMKGKTSKGKSLREEWKGKHKRENLRGKNEGKHKRENLTGKMEGKT